MAAALAGFGIFLATVGLEPVKYTRRFTFDQTWLASGVNLIVVVLGLFALSQALILLTSDDEKIRISKSRGSLFQGFRELARHPRVASISAAYRRFHGHDPRRGRIYGTVHVLHHRPQTVENPRGVSVRGHPKG